MKSYRIKMAFPSSLMKELRIDAREVGGDFLGRNVEHRKSQWDKIRLHVDISWAARKDGGAARDV